MPTTENTKLYTVLSPVRKDGTTYKSGKVPLTPEEATRLLALPEPPVRDPRAPVDDGDDGSGSDAPQPLTEADIVAAIGQLDSGNPKHWTKGNAPQLDALKDILGKPVTGAERDAAWATYQAQQDEAKQAGTE